MLKAGEGFVLPVAITTSLIETHNFPIRGQRDVVT